MYLSDDRIAVIRNVWEDRAPADCLSLAEVNYLEELVMQAQLVRAAASGSKIVLGGGLCHRLH